MTTGVIVVTANLSTGYSKSSIGFRNAKGVILDLDACPDFAARVLVHDDAKRRLFGALRARGTDLLVAGICKIR